MMQRMSSHRQPALRRLVALSVTFLLAGASECDRGLQPGDLKGKQLTLEGIGDVSGVVRDVESGDPVAGADVQVADRIVLTDSAGTFFISRVTVGSHVLSIELSGYHPFTRAIEVAEGANVVGPFSLIPVSSVDPAAITGTVRNARNASPIAGATVSVAGQSTLTAADGSFTVSGILPGSHTMSITAIGFVAHSRSLELASGSNPLGNIVLVEETPTPEHLKTVLILDRSNSMQVSDPAGELLDAAVRYAEQFIDDDPAYLGFDAEIALIGFAGEPQIATNDASASPGFTTEIAEIRAAAKVLVPTLSNTNYDAVLRSAFDLIDAHATVLSSTERAATSYRLVFATDGMPFPDNCPGESNSPAASRMRVQDLRDLATAHQVGLTFDTVLLVSPSMFNMTYLPASTNCPDLQSDESAGWALTQQLQAMADTGAGDMIFATELATLDLLHPAPNPAPVKVMFLVDDSESMGVVDPDGAVMTAVQNAMREIRVSSPFAAVSAMLMGASAKPTPTYDACLPFTPNLVPTPIHAYYGISDHQGALNVATKRIRDDLQRISDGTLCESELPHAQSQLADTRYVVILISDGAPEPVCNAGFGNDPDPLYAGGQSLLCEDQDFLDCLQKNPGYDDTLCFEQPDGSQGLFGQYPDLPSELTAGGAYNQSWQLLAQVHELTGLATELSTGAVDFHTVFIDSSHVDPENREIYGLTNDGQLHSDMADAAAGTYVKVAPTSVSFSHIDFSSLR